MSVVCLGEALVDLVSEPPSERLGDARAFVPYFGGSQANVAVGAARLGVPASLAGCAGDDPWGAWLRDQLAADGVDVSLYELRPGIATALAFVTFDARGEPEFAIHGGADEGMLDGSAGRLRALVADGPAGVLAFGSDTLLTRADRALVAELVPAAAARGWRTLYDPNLRQGRWPDRPTMLSVALEPLPDVTVVKANRAEATLLTGEHDPATAAAALVAKGARQAVVTLGPEGAVFAAAGRLERFGAEPVAAVDTTGAGDAVAAVIAAALAGSRTIGSEAVREAMRVAGSVVGERGALTGFPRSNPQARLEP
jgi:fructokinase